MYKNYKKILIIIILISGIVFLGSKFLLFSNFMTPINEIKVLKNTVFGNPKNNEIFDLGTNNNLLVKNNDNKQYYYLKEKINKLFLFLNKDKTDNQYFFNNQSQFSKSLKLSQYISSDKMIQIAYDSNKLVFSLPAQKIILNNTIYNTNTKTFFSTNELYQNMIIKIDNILYDLNHFKKIETSFNEFNKQIQFFKSDSDNLLNKDIASFASGLWQPTVGDCSNQMSGSADVSMEKYNDDGRSVLKLSSKNHYACTNKTFSIKINKDNIYKLSFDYKNIKGGDVRYYYRLRSSKNKDLSYAFAETVQAKDNNWNNYSIIIDPEKIVKNLLSPEYTDNEKGGGFDVLNDEKKEEAEKKILEDIDLIDIYFYAPSDGSKEVVNLYDDVKLSEYRFDRKENIDLNLNIGDNVVLANNIKLQNGQNIFEYVNNKTNLLGNEETSFENGLWRKKVGDCSNNKPGKSKIKLDESSDASLGQKSMRLYSKNHYACSNKTFLVKLSSAKTYKLQFDYKNITGEDVVYYYNLRNGIENEAHSEKIKAEDNKWHTYETIIEPNIDGIKKIDIFFYAPSDGSKEVVNLYDNVRLTEWLPKDIDSYYLYAEQKVDETPKLNAVEYKAINKWKNRVVLHGVKDSFLLSYPEEYSEKWKAYPVKSDEDEKLQVPDNYKVPEIESNRQATKDELQEFIKKHLISTVGNKFISKNFNGSIRNDNLHNGWFGEAFFKNTIPEETHYQINNYGNAWWVDVDKICKNSKDSKSENICIKNNDGTYDIELVIENKFNRYFNILLLISGTTFISLISYLIYDFAKRQRNGNYLMQKNNKKERSSYIDRL